MIKSRIPPCARDIRERLTHLQREELAHPAEEDEQLDELVDEPVDEHVEDPVELQVEEQLEQDFHAVKVMFRRVHANLGHASKGLMFRLLRDANAPPEMIAVARVFHCPHCDLMTRRTGAVRHVQMSRAEELGHTISIDARVIGRETERGVKRLS